MATSIEKEKEQQLMPFKLYPTENMWIFLKLDTRNGEIWQVQYSINDPKHRFETPLNLLGVDNDNTHVGRYELYPTENIYNFILLDKLKGYVWQAQWDFNEENRHVIPINPILYNRIDN